MNKHLKQELKARRLHVKKRHYNTMRSFAWIVIGFVAGFAFAGVVFRLTL